MLTPVAPSTSNINDRLQCRRHLKAEEVMRLIADIYDRPSVGFRNKADRAGQRRRAAHSAKTSRFRNLSILEVPRHLARIQRRPPADVMR
jgi:hypothetical protein